MVPAAVLAGARDGTELEDVFAAGGEQAFHGQLGGGAEPARAGGDGVDVRLGRVGGQDDGGIDFEEAAFAEKPADRVVQFGPQFQDAALGAQGVGICRGRAHAAGRLSPA